MGQNNYKVGQVLQSEPKKSQGGAGITKWGTIQSKNILMYFVLSESSLHF